MSIIRIKFRGYKHMRNWKQKNKAEPFACHKDTVRNPIEKLIRNAPKLVHFLFEDLIEDI